MNVAKWGNSLAIRLPAEIVEALDLKQGDSVELRIADHRVLEIDRNQSREQALSCIVALQMPLPRGWKFDRDDANSR